MPVRRLPERRGLPAILDLAGRKAENARQERIGERNMRRSRIAGSVARKHEENEIKRAEKTAKREQRQGQTAQIGGAIVGAAVGGVVPAGAAFSQGGAALGATFGQGIGGAATGSGVPNVGASIQSLIRTLEDGRSRYPGAGGTPFTTTGAYYNHIRSLMMSDLDANLATVAPAPNPSAPFSSPRQGVGMLPLP